MAVIYEFDDRAGFESWVGRFAERLSQNLGRDVRVGAPPYLRGCSTDAEIESANAYGRTWVKLAVRDGHAQVMYHVTRDFAGQPIAPQVAATWVRRSAVQ